MSGHAGRDLAFISYSHSDQATLAQLNIWLKPYVRVGQLQVWADPYIRVGDQWRREIDDALKRTRVGVLLVSHHFAASDFISGIELPALHKGAEAGVLHLFCIPVSAVGERLMKLMRLDGYQWARPPGEPLDALQDSARNRAMVEIVDSLLALFEDADEGAEERGAGMHVAGGGPTANLGDQARVTATSPAVTRLSQPEGGEGRLHGVPELPPHFVARSAVVPLRASLLEGTQQRHGISTTTRAGVHGQGGIGKTVLAIAVARDAVVRRSFTDGIFWLTLGQEPDLIGLQRLLLEMATGAQQEFLSLNVGELALREALYDKNCLLILDDVWQGGHATAFDTLGPRGRLLITTRDREIVAALGAVTQNLDQLGPLDACQLLAKWADVRVEELPSEAAQIVAECGYLPLALSLAGARIRDGMRWEAMLQALRDGNLEFLDHAHRSVFKSLSLSVRALPDLDRNRCHELAIFPEDVGVPEDVVLTLWKEASLTDLQAQGLLLSFANKALLSVTGAESNREIRLHDLQGDYLRVTASNLPAAHARLLDAIYRRLPMSESVPARWAMLSTSERYMWAHLLYHLLGAGRGEEADALITSPIWLRAKIEASGVSALLGDLSALTERAPTERNRQVERAIKLEAAWLHRHPEALEHLLYNRLRSDGLSAREIENWVPGLRPPIRLLHPVNFGDGRVFRGHTDTVAACVYSPDGSRILSASHDRTLREWDRASGSELRCFSGHSAAVTACAYSPDGARILSASRDATVREWDRISGTELRRFEGHAGAVTACAYSPDGVHIVSGSWDTTLREWVRATGEVRRVHTCGPGKPVTACIYSRDGSRIFAASYASLWDWAAEHVRAREFVSVHWDKITGCAHAAAGAGLLSVSHDRTLRTWDIASGTPVAVATLNAAINACAVDEAGARVLLALHDTTVREWDMANGQELRSFEGHSERVTSCAYSPDESYVLAASFDNTLREWSRSSDQRRHVARHHARSVTFCALAPDRTSVLSASQDGYLFEWDVTSGLIRRRFGRNRSRVNVGVYSSDGSRFLVASDDALLTEWDRLAQQPINRFEGDAGPVTACAYAPDGRSVLSASHFGTIRECARASGDELRRFDGHRERVTICAYSSDGSRVLSAAWDNTVREWDRASGRELMRLEGHAGPVTACAYSADGSKLLTGSWDHTVREWDRASGRELQRLHGHSAWVTACAYAQGESLIISASGDNTLRFWSTSSGQQVGAVLGAAAFTCIANAGNLLFAGDDAGNVWMLERDF